MHSAISLVTLLVAILILGPLVLLSVSFSTKAEPWMEDAKTCFCLKNPNVGVLRGCTGTRFNGDSYVTARCPQGTKLKVKSPWSAIKGGDDECTPCDNKRPPLKFVPRGDEE